MAKNTMLETFQKAREAYVAARDTITEKMIAEALGELIPEGKMLVWSQYTPYFMDGDPCIFTVNDAHLQDDNGFDNVDPWDGKRLDPKQHPELSAAWKQIKTDKILMEAAFGDHMRVAIRRGGECNVSEHSHD